MSQRTDRGVDAIVASDLIRNEKGLLLVFEGLHGFVALPGGVCECGEKPQETAVREAFEETGLTVHVEKLVALYDLAVLNPDGTEKSSFLHYLFLASTADDNPRPSSEWRDLEAKCRWITLKDLGLYKGVWPLPEEVKNQISKGNLDLGNLGKLNYQTV